MNNSLNKVSAHKLHIILFLLHQYLTVVLDDKLLHWSIHVDAVCKTMQSAPISLRKLASVNVRKSEQDAMHALSGCW